MAEKEVYAYGKPAAPEDMIFYDLSNGTTNDAIGDYSGAVEKFTFVPAAGRIAELERMLVVVQDAGAFPSNKYGYNLVLTNGISVYVRDGNDDAVLNLTAGIPVRVNMEWAAMCYDVDIPNWATGGNESMHVRWTFAKAGKPLRLDARQGHYLSVELHDDFTDLVMHHFLVQGVYVK